MTTVSFLSHLSLMRLACTLDIGEALVRAAYAATRAKHLREPLERGAPKAISQSGSALPPSSAYLLL